MPAKKKKVAKKVAKPVEEVEVAEEAIEEEAEVEAPAKAESKESVDDLPMKVAPSAKFHIMSAEVKGKVVYRAYNPLGQAISPVVESTRILAKQVSRFNALEDKKNVLEK
jgi:hypothetical protein